MNAASRHRPGSVAWRVFAVVLCALAISACSVIKPVKRMLHIGPDRPALKQLKVSADQKANGGNATELDVVVATSDKAVAALPKTGPDWFRQRETLRREFPKELMVVSLEIDTPSPEFEVELPKGTRNDGLSVQVYANYSNKRGWPAIALTPFKRAALRLGPASISVTEEK